MPGLTSADIYVLKPGLVVLAKGELGKVVSVHEPKWVDHVTRASMHVLQGADISFADGRCCYVHCGEIQLLTDKEAELSAEIIAGLGFEKAVLQGTGLKGFPAWVHPRGNGRVFYVPMTPANAAKALIEIGNAEACRAIKGHIEKLNSKQ